jgi:hypothetical protein
MKTTEVFVEQVLIGFLLLTVVGLALWPEVIKGLLSGDAAATPTLDKVVTGAAIIAVAYLLGIVYDRFADTLFQDLEQHYRLESGMLEESALRLNILHTGGSVADYSDYLRTRLRLTRSLATLVPGLTVAWLMAETQPRIWVRWGLLIVYGALFLWKLLRCPPRPPRDEVEPEEAQKYHDKWETEGKGRKEMLKLRLHLFLLREPLSWGLVALTGLAIWIGYAGERPDPWALPLLSGAFTLLTTWVWWRISRTDARLLRDYGNYFPDQARGAAYRCPIPGCEKVFHGSRGGWDGHVGSRRVHPDWHPEIEDSDERKRLFRSEFGHWFGEAVR